MRSFDYHPAASLDEALALLARHGEDAALIAGGTSLVLFMRQGLLRPAHVVGLRGVRELEGLGHEPDGALRLNALLTISAAARASEVRTCCPALADAFTSVATVRIRNQATVGGNLAHADPASDPPVMLLALDAEAIVAYAGGERRVPLASFFLDHFTTVLAPGEILAAVGVPPPVPGTHARYVKFLPRTADDYGTVCVGAALRLDGDGRVADLRIAFGAVGPRPLRARRAEDALRGERPAPSLIAEVAALAGEESDPLDDVRGSAAYKKEMVRVWTERVLRGLVAA